MSTVLSALTLQDAEAAAILRLVPLTVRIWRLEQCREIILAGFQEELYAPEEKPIAYWYLARVLDHHIACIEDILPFIPRGTSYRLHRSPDHRYLRYLSRLYRLR